MPCPVTYLALRLGLYWGSVCLVVGLCVSEWNIYVILSIDILDQVEGGRGGGWGYIQSPPPQP